MTRIDEAVALVRTARTVGFTLTLTGDGGFFVVDPPGSSPADRQQMADAIHALRIEVLTVLQQEATDLRCVACWRQVTLAKEPIAGKPVICSDCADGRVSFALLCALTYKGIGMPLVSHQ